MASAVIPSKMKVVADLVRAHRTEAIDLPSGATGMDLLERLRLAPDAHVLLRGDLPIPVDEPLTEGETVHVISVISGGS